MEAPDKRQQDQENGCAPTIGLPAT
jgi:hypothetical protein